jgi:hypothetical protein
MDFFEFLKTSPYETRIELEKQLDRRMPRKAFDNPDFEWKARLNRVLGDKPEDFRDRRPSPVFGDPEYKSFQIESTKASDRRQFNRHPLRCDRWHFVAPGFDLPETIPVDISAGGVSVRLKREYELTLGTKVGVGIFFGDKEVMLVGDVANVRDSSPDNIVGVKFEPGQSKVNADVLKELVNHSQMVVEDEKRNRRLAS